jgi:hypothetical protein
MDLPFEGDIDLARDYKIIVEKFNPDILIETGTHLGNTTKYLCTFGIPVLALEKNQKFVQYTKDKVGDCAHFEIIEGDSANTLESKIEDLTDKKILAFLDAHWGGGMTLERELEFFAKINIKPFLILHDFYNPHHPEYNYDSHDGHAYTYEYFKPYIEKIYGDNYKYQFNSEPNTNTKKIQGTLFIKPTEI